MYVSPTWLPWSEGTHIGPHKHVPAEGTQHCPFSLPHPCMPTAYPPHQYIHASPYTASSPLHSHLITAHQRYSCTLISPLHAKLTPAHNFSPVIHHTNHTTCQVHLCKCSSNLHHCFTHAIPPHTCISTTPLHTSSLPHTRLTLSMSLIHKQAQPYTPNTSHLHTCITSAHTTFFCTGDSRRHNCVTPANVHHPCTQNTHLSTMSHTCTCISSCTPN